jgi:hypothetical protein
VERVARASALRKHDEVEIKFIFFRGEFRTEGWSCSGQSLGTFDAGKVKCRYSFGREEDGREKAQKATRTGRRQFVATGERAESWQGQQLSSIGALSLEPAAIG